MTRQLRGSLFGCFIALFIALFIVAPATAQQPTATLELTRHLETNRLAPGETTVITLQVTNHGSNPVDFNLIEEIGPRLELLATDGNYNQNAGFIVWRGSLAAATSTTVFYEARLLDARAPVVPLYAYVSGAGQATEHSDSLHAAAVPMQLTLNPTSVAMPDAALLTVRLDNPFNRSLTVQLDMTLPQGIILDEPLDSPITLDARTDYEVTVAVLPEIGGQFPVTVIPRISGVAAGDPKQATLTVYENKNAAEQDASASAVAPVVHGAVTTPGEAVRTHRLHFPSIALSDGNPLVVVAPLPPLAVYVPGSAVLNGQPTDPVVHDEYLLFYMQDEQDGIRLPNDVELSYTLRYADKEAIAVDIEKDNERVGVISLGPLPRLLRGTDDMLTVLNAPLRRQLPARTGVAILHPLDGQVFSGGDQTTVEVDAPIGATVQLTLNGEPVDDARLGGVSEDTNLERTARQYVAITLQPGENRLTATAFTAAGEQLIHEIVVRRAGNPTVIYVDAVTELATGRIHPLVFQITALDENGLPPADGTEATVKLQGGIIVSDDARPDWLGHQLLLYGGRGYVAVAPPAEATQLVLDVNIGSAQQRTAYAVTNQIDEWFVIGHAGIKADGIGGNEGVRVHTTVRALAQGPMPHDSVLTLAVNNSGLTESASSAEFWTGDTSQSGATGIGTGPVYARLERGLSYVQYGLNDIDFAGTLSQYSNSLSGLKLSWHDTPEFTFQAFLAREALDKVQEVIAGDGTGYYRLEGRHLVPFSEDIAIVVRDPRFPHDVIRVMRLQPTRYFLDYETGQLVLAEPLPSADENGNEVSLRIRYRLHGESNTVAVGGGQATYDTDRWLLRGTLYNRVTEMGTTVQFVGAEGEARLGPVTLQADAARTWGDGEGNAVTLSAQHTDVFGWTLLAQHRRLDPDFAAANSGGAKGISTSAVGQRVWNGIGVTARVAINQAHRAAPWTREAAVTTRWLKSIVRPQLGFKVTDGLEQAMAVSGHAGATADIPQGSISYVREQPLWGTAQISDTVEARYELSRHHILQVSHQARRAGWNGPAVTSLGIALTQSLQGERLQTHLRSGYNLPGGQSLAEGNLAFGLNSTFAVNERSKLSFSLDHRRPLVTTQPSGYGSTLGWKYRHVTGGESEWRFDMHWQGASAKYALHWQGLHPINEALTVRGNAMLTADHAGEQRFRLIGAAAYRGARTVLLGQVLTDHIRNGAAPATDLEWRLQAGLPLDEHWIANAGYARQSTTQQTTTDKLTVGTRYSIRPHVDLLAEASWLRQQNTKSSRSGLMVGAGYELLDNLWVTAGYGSTGYVGYDSSGDRFAQNQDGLFIQFDWAFDDWALRNWLRDRDS